MAGRIFAIGDIHGYLKNLDCLLDIIQPGANDLVVTLGDLVDRGPDSKGVIERLLEIQDSTMLVPLCGNHDIMFSQNIKRQEADPFWLGMGGKETLESFGIDPDDPDYSLMDPKIPDFLTRDLLPFFEHEKTICVHATLSPFRPLLFQTDDELFWNKLDPLVPPHPSGKIVVCGHTRQVSGEPLWLGHLLCLDTNVYDGGWLTACDLMTLEYWQVNSEGTTRKGALKPKP